VSFDDGSTCFVKAGREEWTAAALRREYAVYSQLQASFMPRLLAWQDDGSAPLLILEDLSEAIWPPPWTETRIQRVLETIASVRAMQIDGLPLLSADRACQDWWPLVSDEPGPFNALGLASPRWLELALPTLGLASKAAPFDGDELVHFDLRSDNLCFAGERCILIDWNFAALGNGAVDIATWLPSLEAEGGPPPESTLADAGALAAWMSGYWAWHAGLRPGPPDVRHVQLEQLRRALPWAIRALGLPPLDGPNARKDA
jgi:hypothetical protein